MVAGGKQCSSGSTITLKHALQILTDASKEGWGAPLNERTARGIWPLPESKLHINYLELKAVFLALKEFQDLCLNNIVLVATDNTTVVAYINKEGDEVGPPMCPYRPPGLTTNGHNLCHWFQTPRLGQWMQSVCPGKIWTRMPSHWQPSWAKWLRSWRTTHATGSY